MKIFDIDPHNMYNEKTIFISSFINNLTHTTDCLTEIVKKQGVKPEQCVYINRENQNLDAALQLGMKTIQVGEDHKQFKQALITLNILKKRSKE